MGGWATWDLAMAYPGYFAAIAPICGRIDRNYPERAAELKDMPIWVFHGAQDNIVPIQGAENMVKRLQEAGNPVKFTVYPDAGHDSWTETYNNPELYRWFMEHHR
jgi:predicted peptidase